MAVSFRCGRADASRRSDIRGPPSCQHIGSSARVCFPFSRTSSVVEAPAPGDAPGPDHRRPSHPAGRRHAGAGARRRGPRGGFTHGGWAVPYGDAVLMAFMTRDMGGGGALLFGRRTYEDFFKVWPGRTDNPFTAVLNRQRK